MSGELAAADLDGSPNASTELAAEASRMLGGRVDVLVNNAVDLRGGACEENSLTVE